MSIAAPNVPASAAPTSAPSRTAAWLPWAVVAAMATIVVTTLVVTDNSASISEPAYPTDQLANPRAPFVWAYAFAAAWVLLLIGFVVQTVRNKTISMPAMLFTAGTTMFWIEWPADWGAYLVYNRDFWNFTGWTSTWYQTYWKPVNVVFGYGVFFTVECVILLKVVPRVTGALRRAIPKASETLLLIVSCMIVFYTVDILGERLMTWCGWYSYVDPVGPAWTSDRGTISFVWPAIPFLLFAIAITLVLRQDANGDYPNEKFFRVHTLKAGWPKQFARLAVWIITMNVAIFIAQPLILCIGRVLFFPHSAYVP